jgi:hypothetical protein
LEVVNKQGISILLELTVNRGIEVYEGENGRIKMIHASRVRSRETQASIKAGRGFLFSFGTLRATGGGGGWSLF